MELIDLLVCDVQKFVVGVPYTPLGKDSVELLGLIFEYFPTERKLVVRQQKFSKGPVAEYDRDIFGENPPKALQPLQPKIAELSLQEDGKIKLVTNAYCDVLIDGTYRNGDTVISPQMGLTVGVLVSEAMKTNQYLKASEPYQNFLIEAQKILTAGKDTPQESLPEATATA